MNIPIDPVFVHVLPNSAGSAGCRRDDDLTCTGLRPPAAAAGSQQQ